MKYMGSKSRIAKYIAPIMIKAAEEKNIKTFVDIFVGGGNLIDKIPQTFRRIGIDLNPHTICALKAIRDDVDILPDSLSESEYKDLKGSDPENIKSWLRFVASFGGKFDNGYARESGSDEATFVGYGKRNAIKQSPLLAGVDLIIGNYKDFNLLSNCLIYCDPPYFGTTGYKTGEFDHEEFWKWAEDMSERNLVFISEYNAPSKFKCVWHGSVKTNFAKGRKHSFEATERLFTLK